MALRADDVDLGRDRDLVARYQSGDPSAFDDLYRCYFERLRRFCARHTADRHEAEEVAQEAFVRALASMHSLEGERRFYPWMTVIARRLCIDRHRKFGRVEPCDEVELGSVEPDVDHLFDAVDADHVRQAMQRLGPRHREVLLLREAEQLRYADIADRLDVPVTTVEALLHRARKALRREFAAVGGDARGLWGLPVFGWVSTKAASLRSKLTEHWVEIAAVAAPVALGAATAAVVLVPGTGTVDDAPQLVAGAPATSTIVEPGASLETDLAEILLRPAGHRAVAPPSPAPASPSPSPTASAGPVDVFTGPDGTDQARDEADRMPLSGAAGPATGGADGNAALDHTEDFVEEVVDLLVGRAPESPAPADSSSDSADPLDALLGGTP